MNDIEEGIELELNVDNIWEFGQINWPKDFQDFITRDTKLDKITFTFFVSIHLAGGSLIDYSWSSVDNNNTKEQLHKWALTAHIKAVRTSYHHWIILLTTQLNKLFLTDLESGFYLDQVIEKVNEIGVEYRESYREMKADEAIHDGR